jgi:DNA helicase-2/ATP-dependent DNA helicase PcrA
VEPLESVVPVESVESVVPWAPEAGDPAGTDRFSQARDSLTRRQLEAVESPGRALCIVAGAGSGKTRVLTLRVAHRIRQGTADADHTAVCTFTRKAAHELRERLRLYGVPVSTPAPSGGVPGPGVRAGTLHQLGLTLLRRHALDTGQPPPVVAEHRWRAVATIVGDPSTASTIDTEIGWAKARCLRPELYADAARSAERVVAVEPGQVESAFSAYQDSLSRRHALDLDDVLIHAADLFHDDAGFAERMRWRYRHFSVDEFQDVNPAQFRLIEALLGSGNDLCAVGDPNQAIYGWNGADPTLLTRLPQMVGGMEVVRLDENHRSTPQVVAAATAALGRSATAPPRSVADVGPMPVVTAFDDDTAEAEGVVSMLLERAEDGASWSDQAVLARTHDQLATVARALARAGIPHRVAPGPESPAGTVTGTARTDGTGTDGADGAGAGAGAGTDGAGARAVVSPPSRRTPRQADDAVELATFHRAKGLEWPSVHVVGLEEGFVPIVYAESTEARAEERRLLYVALTRASVDLHCSWARSRRMANGRTMDRQPSPWLAAVARVSRAGTGRVPRRDTGRMIDEMRAGLGR